MKPAFGIVIVIAIFGACTGARDPVLARQRAHAVLTEWANAVAAGGGVHRVIPVGNLTGQIGDWEPAVGDNNKRALIAGLVLTDAIVSDAVPPEGVVTWQDGTTTKVPLLSAHEALGAIGSSTSGPCDDCAALMVTAARLTSGPIETTRGPATAPIWEFSVRGSAVRVTRVAIANPVVAQITEADPELGVAIDSASGTVGGFEVTVAFIGAPDPGDNPCGEDYTTEAVESELAVVVIVTRHPHLAPLGEACAGVGARRTAVATLAAPLGDRAVLDLLRGTPVTTAVAP